MNNRSFTQVTCHLAFGIIANVNMQQCNSFFFCQNSEKTSEKHNIYESQETDRINYSNLAIFFFSVFLKGSLITLTSLKQKLLDELFLLILSATASWEQDNREGNTKEEDTDTTFKIRYEVVCGTNTSLCCHSVKNNCFHAPSSTLSCHQFSDKLSQHTLEFALTFYCGLLRL